MDYDFIINDEQQKEFTNIFNTILRENKQTNKNINVNDKDKYNNINNNKITKNVIKRTQPKNKRTKEPLSTSYYTDNTNNTIIEIGIDEAGRGPLFGRVYCAAVILPKNSDKISSTSFNHALMKDSKTFSSHKKLMEAYNHIKEHCVLYSVCYSDENEIDNINIREATLKTMHKCIDKLVNNYKEKYGFELNSKTSFILVDGNAFHQYKDYKYVCIEGGDNLYTPIAAASILAKVERDAYIQSICNEHPLLNTYYDIGKNKGYGTKKHLEGIQKYGISPWHRKTFGRCKYLNIADEFLKKD
jgi:ribonuclease HII